MLGGGCWLPRTTAGMGEHHLERRRRRSPASSCACLQTAAPRRPAGVSESGGSLVGVFAPFPVMSSWTMWSPLTPGPGSSWASGVWGVPRRVCEERRAVRVPLKAVRCSLRERRRGMSVNKQTQAEPGTEKGGSGSPADPPAIPEEHDPDGGIDPGTPFAQIADEWICPICGARKTDFRGLEAERRSRWTGKTDPCSTDTTAS
jgi:rubredoxin